MIGPVDYEKNMDFWQLDKWNGFFPVKWHIVKDVPNTLLRHITLENNDNRPVTYTRDTQEVLIFYFLCDMLAISILMNLLSVNVVLRLYRLV